MGNICIHYGESGDIREAVQDSERPQMVSREIILIIVRHRKQVTQEVHSSTEPAIDGKGILLRRHIRQLPVRYERGDRRYEALIATPKDGHAHIARQL